MGVLVLRDSIFALLAYFVLLTLARFKIGAKLRRNLPHQPQTAGAGWGWGAFVALLGIKNTTGWYVGR